jgi:hypothetical protein
MRVFNQLVFEGYVKGTASVYSDSVFDEQLGLSDQLSVAGYSAQVTGTSPTITIQVENSFDQRRWQNRNGVAEINGIALATSGETTFQGQDGWAGGLNRPALHFARLRISLGGTSPAAQLRIWAVGRDRKA